MGWYIGGSIALGIFAGHWLDNKLDTSLLWIVGLIFGLVMAFYGVYRMFLPLIKHGQDKEND